MIRNIFSEMKQTNKIYHKLFRYPMMIVMLMCFTSAWAQTDYSGAWYIASGGKSSGNGNNYTYNSDNPNNNFYLCPTEGWCYYKPTNDFSSDGTTYPNPFLTTYKCRNGVYDATKAVWIIKKAPSPNNAYYYIIQKSTGKYLVSNGQIRTTSNPDRIRVHLESIADPTSEGDKVLFDISPYNGYLVIRPMGITDAANLHDGHGNHKWLTVNNGNYENLIGNSGKTGGPTGYTIVSGIICIYTKEDINAPFYLEEVFLKTPTFTINASGNVEISTTETGATIYYTTDGSDPDNSATRQTYSGPITPSSSMASIKAIVIGTYEGISMRSEIATQPLYTFHMVNLANNIAIKRTVAMEAGLTLRNYTSVPAAIRSPYLAEETLTFYSFSGTYDAANLVAGNVITQTPSSSANIYVKYTNNHLMGKFLHLRAYRTFNLTLNGDYIYDSGGGTWAHTSSATITNENKSDDAYLWYIGKSGAEDPYAVQVRNKSTDKYLNYSTPSTLTLNANPSNFILMSGSAPGDGANYEQMELMAATGDDNYYRVGRTGDSFSISGTASGDASLQFRAYPQSAGITYYLIDKAGKLIEVIESKSDAVDLPDAWKSPLVATYTYYSTSGYDSGTDTYEPTDVIDVTNVSEGAFTSVYVKYVANDDISFDEIDNDEAESTTYMLKFYGGDSFRQENGADGIMPTSQQAVYPYANGDACLYVYGEQQWTAQQESGATTRNRWLWHVVSANKDPYRVKIMSHSGQVGSTTHNYFRTYAVEYGGSAHIVTGVTTMNEAVSNPASANYQPPTEYMVLKAPNNRCKLVTVNKVTADLNGNGNTLDEGEDERRTVTNFEQYWKNAPTVQKELGNSAVTGTETASSNIVLSSSQVALLSSSWHTYEAFAYAAPWVEWTDNGDNVTSKRYLKKNHWFQTINMGSTGEFTFEATALEPQVILLDQHGWEIMRRPLYDALGNVNTELRAFNSPMVETYHWYPTAEKAAGHHKFTVGDPTITIYYYNTENKKWQPNGETTVHTSTQLDDSPYSHITPEQGKSVMTDFYVTYDVKPEYAKLYKGAATKAATVASAFLLKQDGKYAKKDGTTLTYDTTEPSLESSDIDALRWYLRPNFDIDAEMGYKYRGEEGAQDGALSKLETETAYYANGGANNKNGFDPYNVQIQSAEDEDYYFTANTTGSHLSNGIWTGNGTSSTITLQTLRDDRQTPDGYDQSTLQVTNATFMVVDDGIGNMRLMPRFDHTKVVTSFNSLSDPLGAGAPTQKLTLTMTPQVIHSSSELSLMSGHYILASNFTFEAGFQSLGTSSAPFTGSIDGQLHTFTGLRVPLIAYSDGATIKNIILDNVDISSNNVQDVGAIVCNAAGDTRIYNCGILATNSTSIACSSTVSGNRYVGGIVGRLDGKSRVINCYSYANITNGTTVGGIVGYNTFGTKQGSSQSDFDSNVKTMVVNCMFYGDITGGTTKYPVYGGQKISNSAADRVNNYNYYLEENATFDDNYSEMNNYNCSWPVAKKYLTRYEVYRNILNSNRRLCTWWVSGTYNTAPTDADVENVGIAKWVLDPAIAPYPILKPWGKYYSSFDIDPTNAYHAKTGEIVSRSTANAWEGKSYGTLSVTIDGGSNNSSARKTRNITITDMDTLSYDYCAKKIQLPYYNDVFGDPNSTNWAEKYANNYTDKVVTGWKITNVTGGTPGEFKEAWEDGYNFADRKCTNKDKYSVSGRVFAQGGYYYVPDGVTSITIEAYWGNAVYLCNNNRCLDRANNGSANFYNGGQLPNKVNGTYDVQTSLADAINNKLSVMSTGTVYDQAIVLVGNYQDDAFHSKIQLKGSEYESKAKPFTIMSADFDLDNEPDFCFQGGMNGAGRPYIQPIRFDFLMVPDITMAIRANTNYFGMRIFCPQGHFEVTETSYIYITQFEYDKRNDNNYAKHEAPMILNGGEFMQIVSSEAFTEAGANKTATTRVDATSYFLMGGKLYMKAFTPGCHGNKKIGTRHCAVNAIGGEYPEFYLSGMFRSDFYNMTDNPHCYIDGGKFGLIAGAGMESVGGEDETDGGDITFKINNSWIEEFYGGGINALRPVTGNIEVTCDNSIVHKYCGGPKLGDMNNSKTIKNTATNTIFNQFYGGGNGGTNLMRDRQYDAGAGITAPTYGNHSHWDGDAKFSAFTPFTYDASKGYQAEYEFEMLPRTSGDGRVITRSYYYWASFAKTKVAPITNTITDCTFNWNFYGGGNLGAVDGDVESTLKGNTLVKGSAFGAGYSAAASSFKVHNKSTVVYPYRDFAGFIHDGSLDYSDKEYIWIHDIPAEWNKTASTSSPTFDYGGKSYCYTPEDLTGLGAVSGSTKLTIQGNTEVKGNVFGGGDESAVNTNSQVIIEGNAVVRGDVFGAGNASDVEGNAEVTMTSGSVEKDIYGGGKGQMTVVGGNVTVNIGTKSGVAPSITYAGTGTVNGNVYGGSAFGAVNTTKNTTTNEYDKTTAVNIYAGTVEGSVFGGGLGQLESGTVGNTGYLAPIAAQNYGSATVTIENSNNAEAWVKTAVYGGSNLNGVLRKDATVTITGGTVGTLPSGTDPITNVVFGGGFGEPTLVEGDVQVNIGTSGLATDGAAINGHVYGGGALGSVNARKPESALVFDGTKKVDVNLYKGLIHGNVYGGGLGRKAVTGPPAVAAVESYVGGDVTVKLDGAAFHLATTTVKDDANNDVTAYTSGQIFGGNNLNGTPKGHVLVHVKQTVAEAEHTGDTYYLGAVYGGGNEANYVPTDAKQSAEVVIEGCGTTKIKDVYGGGNAAAVPATEVWILACSRIENVFGGGNGELGPSHAAHVGFYRESDLSKTDYTSGTGKTFVNLVGGTITNVFGGSNSNGDIRGGSNIQMPQQSEYTGDAVLNSPAENCPLNTTNIYGGGKNADMSGGTNIVLGCMPDAWVGEIYAGAQNADVAGNVNLTITSGKFYRVFGGNKDGGKLEGSITVNIEETGTCDVPIVIGELYGGGNLAGYSIYGYNNDGTPKTKATFDAENEGKTDEQKAKAYDDPELNIRAFTSIGSIFGGGYQAKMIANPHVDINVVKGSHAATARAEETITGVSIKKKNETTGEIEDATITLHLPAHAENKIGVIEHVFGGGNLAEVVGDATVNIGTETSVNFITEPKHLGTIGTDYTYDETTQLFSATVEGANITGNVYGGGQDAVITGNTQVNICAKKGEGDAYTSVSANSANVTIAGDVFGAGKGLTTTVNNTKIVMGGGSVKESIYGGGELGSVEHDTDISVIGGEIGDENVEHGGATIGNVYGGGQGNLTTPTAGLIKGNTTINISAGTVSGEPKIYHNVYGGGAYGSVGTYTYDSGTGETTCADNTGLATINITGGTIGINGKENGMVFGSSRGDVAKPTGSPAVDPNDMLAWVHDTRVTIGSTNDETAGPTIRGSVYGSGENGHTYHNTEVIVHSGTIGINNGDDVIYYKDNIVDPSNITYEGKDYNYPYRGNVYGGGCGTDTYKDNENHDTYNPLAGIVRGTASVTIDGGKVVRNVYGAGAMGSVDVSTSVIISGNAEIGVEGGNGGYVYAAARGDEALDDANQAYVGASALTISGGTVRGSAFGGGQSGIVKGAVSVALSGGSVEHDVYGGGALAKTNTEYHATNNPDYITTVTLNGATIAGNLYGGGLGCLADVSEGIAAVEADVVGPVTVSVTGGTATNVFGCNNINGAPKSTVDVVIGTKTGAAEPYTYGGTGTISGSVYGGGKDAAYSGTPEVKLYGGTVENNVYGGGLGSTATTGGSSVTMEGGTVNNDVFGGGSEADVTGSVSVSISGGTVVNDVYGGGALANTNTGNWDPTANGGAGNWKVASSTAGNFYYPVKHVTKDATVVTGYYTRSGSEGSYTYTEVTEAGKKADEGITYYKKLPAEYTTEIHNILTDGTTYKTSVSATGGVIGNIYGGGLGQLGANPIPAMVYGDVTVTVNGAAFSNELVSYNYTAEEAIAYNAGLKGALNSTDPLTADQATTYNAVIQPETAKAADDILSAGEAAAYNARLSGAVSTSDAKNVAKTGRVFGCNNLNGTPKGQVLVQVNQTVREDGGQHVDDDFEIFAVYGGGNAADYEPQTYDFQTEFGQHTKVIIDGCHEVSIEKVYGGGNAAAVPFTDVLIEGAFQIGYVFGGGNGGDRLYYNDSWHENLGANVTGYTNVLLRGGTIGQYFGGSDTRGTVGGTETHEEHEDDGCPLKIVNFYGAGNGEDATTLGDITINVSGCGSSINKVFGGSYKANVKGSITLNIKSGVYTSVYGGNDRMGSVGGNITVNIEETDDCGTPIIIQNLFGGCYETPYPGSSASKYIGPENPTEEQKANPANYTPFTRGKITVNVKSATRIDKVYGGSYKAGVNGDTEVNINMTHGSRAGKPYELPAGYRGNPIPNIHGVPQYNAVATVAGETPVNGLYTFNTLTSEYEVIDNEDAKAETEVTYYEMSLQGTIDDAIGTIGYVFGGGYQGVIDGDATVNIGTETEVDYKTTVTHLTPNANSKYDVQGAHIDHDVFGGGNLADVMGSTEVNICAKKNGSGVYEAVAEGAEKVTLGGSVYGGGREADIKKNTQVTMSGGYVFNGIVGGGLAGSVGTYTSRDYSSTVYGHTAHAGCIGKPTVCQTGTGKCTVVVNGGQVGPVEVATEGMKRAGGPVAEGWVWGASKGVVEDPATHPDTHFKAYVNETDLTIGGTALIMEGVIGGGEFGHVLGNTLVKIEGGQIGIGEMSVTGSGTPADPYVAVRYSDADFIDPTTSTAAEIEAKAAIMPECPHWDYGRNIGTNENPNWVYEPYDPYYYKYPSTHFTPGSTTNPSDGKSWIGVVFGGGSGYYPYEKADGSGYDWNPSAGWVEGDTEVRITGGHILNNVYGANEYTDVGGKSTVKMSGGTIGVPRTLAQIEAHPLSCYLFGAGRGDERTHFNDYCKTGSVEVEVSGGIIYGSVFGGSEDGQVTGNVVVNIKPGAKIGTWGTSYVDGNVFGGGRGYSGANILAGNVGGNVAVNITGGTMLGSIYGGGRLASVGLNPSTGEMQDGDGHGHITLDISGSSGTGKTVIGNKYEFMYLTSSVNTSGKTDEEIAAARKAELKNTYHVTVPDFTYQSASRTGDYDHYMINHTRGGCVYGGGMGRRELLDGTKNTVVDWTKLGSVKSTKVKIHGTDVWIKGSLFTGGEYGAVTGSHTSEDDKTVGTEAIINGDVTIGSVIGKTNDVYNSTLDSDDRTETGSNDDSRYCYGGVYGGGFGTEVDATLSTPISEIKNFGALVSSNTSIKLLSGAVRSSLYGGGKVACVAGDTYVTVSGGTVGVGQTRQNPHPSMGPNYVLFGGMRMGNVYGGGRGSVNSVVAGVVKGNTNINITDGNIYHNIYGGGAVSSVGDFDLTTDENKASYGVMYANVPVNWKENTGVATISITGGTIGTNGHDSGMVNGSSRGDISTNQPTSTAVSDPYDHVAWVNKSIVTIGAAGQGFAQPQIKGSVYGGGENGHNYGDAEVYVHSGTIGVVDTPEDTWSNRGSIYGAGCGTDTYSKHFNGSAYVDYTDGYNHYNPMGGRVQGNTTVSVDGGHVIRDVYGGGSMGSVNGNATVTVSGGRIGTDGNDNGDVFGGPKGSLKIDPTDAHAEAHVENSTVTISYATTPATDDGSTTHAITGSVYGGGEAGLARGNVTVNMNGGLVMNNLYGGGALADTNTNNWDETANSGAGGWAAGKTSASNTTTVNLKGGRIMHNAYGGALGRAARAAKDAVYYTSEEIAAASVGDPAYGKTTADIKTPAQAAITAIDPMVYGNIKVELNNNNNGRDAIGTVPGCIVNKVFGCNDLQGTPKGHVKVHVFATQNKNTATISDKVGPVYSPTLTQGKTEGYIEYLTRLINMAMSGVDVLAGIDEDVITAANSAISGKVEASLTDGEKTNISNNAKNVIAELEKLHDYDVEAVYGGGDLAPYEPAVNEDKTEVVIEGCDVTSIKQVYGGGNAASVPATDLLVKSAFIIDEVFGGGNGLDNYTINDLWYENPGANVGYRQLAHYVTDDTQGTGADEANKYKAITNTSPDATTPESRKANYSYGAGTATTTINGGHIHNVYGGSNEKGNIRTEALLQLQQIGTCAMITDKTFGGSKSAEIDAEINTILDCVEDGGTYFGGSYKANINNDINIRITNGHYDKIFGGNDRAGTINGKITITIEENGCTPITIDELYGGGNLAPYSIYGYKKDASGNYIEELAKDENGNPVPGVYQRVPARAGETSDAATPYRNPHINIISATNIGTIYGGGYKALMIGDTHINVNMTEGRIREAFKDKDPSYASLEDDENGNKILPIGTIGNIYGGGNMADIIGNTVIEIGTGTHHTDDDTTDEPIVPLRNAAKITGNVYGGGKMGHVGDFTLDGSGKPISCAEGTGQTHILISNGEIGLDNMQMFHLDSSGNIVENDHPDDAGHVYGGGQGTLDYYYDDTSGMTEAQKVTGMLGLGATAEAIDAAMNAKVGILAFVDSTDVVINGTAWVKGCVFGGSENGHVLHNTGVKIGGDCQIGNGHILSTDASGNITVNRGVNRRYTAAEWAAGRLFVDGDLDIPTPYTSEETVLRTAAAGKFTASLPECASWLYGDTVVAGQILPVSHHSPYDKFAGTSGYKPEGGARIASNGHTFNGNVFGGGSGFYPFAPGHWLETAGEVEGDTWVEVTGGHIMTSLYGGNEMSSVLRDTHIKMTGGTVGVPRTVDEIIAHPVTCYVFGGGKGESRSYLDHETNVRNTTVDIKGGWVYGSVFGGSEDGHVIGDAKVKISGTTKESPTYAELYAGTATKIGTWGTSYVEGNIFGGGRGFDGHNLFAGCVEGNTDINISGGLMLGSVYGGGRLGSVGINNRGDEMIDTDTETHGHATITISGGVIGNKYEFIYPQADNIPDGLDADFKNWKTLTGEVDAAKWTTWKNHNHVPLTEFDTSNGRLTHTKGGNVYAGGMGRREKLDGVTEITGWQKLGAVKSTSLTVSGDPWIMSCVYGGGELGAVRTAIKDNTDPENPVLEGGTTTINIQNGTIGSEITSTTVQKATIPTTDTRSDVKYTFGSVYGGGMGTQNYGLTEDHGGDVEGNTMVSISGATTKVRASVFGGGEMAIVEGSTTVNISGGEIGRNEVKPTTDPDAGYVLFGSSTMGNVYGGGKGYLGHTMAGLVKGNTTINVSGGNIYHMIYGGGALGSVGTFRLAHKNWENTGALSPDTDLPDIPEGIPLEWKAGTGNTLLNITGGTIGISGRDNGLVFGSSRGDLTKPTGSPLRDPYDYLAWINNSVVNVGTEGSSDLTSPHIICSLYGGGENGHNKGDATVNVYSGTIGITDSTYTWYHYTDKALEKRAWSNRGNVYGAGSGVDTYSVTVGGTKYSYYNPKSGMVAGNTYVNIMGGHVGHNVYGGGSMSSVGYISNAADTTTVAGVPGSAKHLDKATSFALSWPYNIEFEPNTGKSYVTITGGRIGIGETGIVGDDNGNVYGGSRGVAASHYYEAHLANVSDTYVTINYAGETPTSDAGYTTPLIAGSVFGGSENGHVMGDTHVSMQNGLIKHSLFAAGRGQGTFQGRLKKLTGDGDTELKDIRSITAGKTYGNTYLEMSGGRVWHNVFGGGYMASVGKGNYSGGLDDYATIGYGETISTNLWDGVGDDSQAFLNSGKTFLTITGGTIGMVGPSLWDGLPSGCVFGSSRGVSAPNITDYSKISPEYCPDFFSGYVNETCVTIGGDYKCVQACVDNNSKTHIVGEALTLTQLQTLFKNNSTIMNGTTPSAAYWEPIAGDGPTIYGSVYGGGQDGHVRRKAHMIVNKGEIGLPYTDANRAALGTSGLSLEAELNSPHWLLRGNVFGAGSGLGQYSFDMDGDSETADETGYSSSAGSVTHFTQVDINGGIIHRNVYGGGSLASVGPPPVMSTYDIRRKDDTSVGIGHRSQCTVNIAGRVGTPNNPALGLTYNQVYGGEVYGASRGLPEMKPRENEFSYSIWTKVNILKTATVMGNVFGGGDAGMVKKDAEVVVGGTSSEP